MDALAVADIFLFQGFRLDRRGGVLFGRDHQGVFAPIAIGRRALGILGVLVEHPGDLISRDDIIEAVWPGRTVEDSNLNVQVAALRRILDAGRAESSCIQTVAGRGYRFVGPVTRIEPQAVPSGSGSFGHVDGRQSNGPGTGDAGHIGVAPRLSIVVLPFTNLSNDPEQQYFADGITEDLTTDLSRIAESFVISCNTAFTYRNKRVDTKQIGRELGVRYVLEGSVRKTSNQIRVNAQLIDAETDSHLWAERYEGDTSNVFALQDEITRQIAVALDLELTGVEATRPIEDPDALNYFLRGRAARLKLPSRESRAEAIDLFERALALDQRSAAAQSYLAITLVARVLDNVTDTAASDIARAEVLARQALAALPRSPFAHYAKGQVLRAQRRYDEAISEYETVLALDRNSVRAYAHIGQCKLYTGSIEEVIPLEEKAIQLSPRDPEIGHFYVRIGQVRLLQSRIDEAILWFEKARSANTALSNNHSYLAALRGEAERAAAELAETRRLSGDNRYSSIARLKAVGYWWVPRVDALFDATYFAGLRKAGMPEE